GLELANGGLANVTVSLTGGETLTLTANRTPDGSVSVSSGTLDVSTFTLNRSSGGGTFSVSNGATLRIGGTSNFPANFNTNTLSAGSTVVYYGDVQTVRGLTYGNLTLDGTDI